MTILVFGNVTIDLVFKVDKLPQPGETVLAGQRDIDIGGKGANQAVVAARFGADVRLVAAVGDDADGRLARDRLSAEDIDLTGLLTVGEPTDQSVIAVDKAGENSIISSHAAARSLTPEHAVAACDGLRRGDWLVVQGNLGQEVTLAALKESRQREANTLLNPAPIQWPVAPLLPFVDLLVVNRVELEALCQTQDPALGGRQLRDAGADRAVVTLGSDGAAIIGADGVIMLPAGAVDAIDTAGAGDTFCGALVAALAEGARPTTAAMLGIKAAAITVSRTGTQSAFPSAEEAQALKSEKLGKKPG